jgi:Tol biopolymer transport system component
MLGQHCLSVGSSLLLALLLVSTPQAQLFMEGVINTSADEYGPAFAPDGMTMYFTRRVSRQGPEYIYVSRFENGQWSKPEIAPFSGKHFDKEPFVSPDGSKLFFASLRPVGGVEKKDPRDFDIWVITRSAGGWGDPTPLPAPVNSTGYDNYPSVAANGTLYFASVRGGGRGRNDLYRAPLIDGKYSQVEKLGDIINTSGTDADPYIAPDESFLIYCSDRQGGFGEGDLYISYNRGGAWTEPRNLGAAINTGEFEYTPLLSPDGKYLFFSRGWGEIYRIESRALSLKPESK